MYREFLVFVICTYAVHIEAHIKTIDGPTGCSQYDCKYLCTYFLSIYIWRDNHDQIVNYVDQSKDVCKDIYSFTCNATDEGIFSEESMRSQYVMKLIERAECNVLIIPCII
ncbi:hypothetical protein TSAR_015321 [Trichomalopsis sarcophagae]|uniref:Uncharacterized protein n=1 Tax=Trichomalopsis sarcophagae TaxID=543379 RepID=A0A232ERU4_9HYME|nr:hypothetical protein TSAR_015321 [Trichomalopsis sarcophagae]